MGNRMSRVAKRVGPLGESAQAYVEFALALPVYIFLLAVAGAFAWWWWSNLLAATAIAEGVRVAAVEGSDTIAGNEETMHILISGLGQSGREYEGRYVIRPLPVLRSLWGGLRFSLSVSLRDMSNLPVTAGSFQRMERFYPGPPAEWE